MTASSTNRLPRGKRLNPDRVKDATPESLQSLFGSGGLLIGSLYRPDESETSSAPTPSEPPKS